MLTRLSSGKKIGNRLLRIVRTCDSVDPDMPLLPNWRESRGVNQFPCSWGSAQNIEICRAFSSVSVFHLNTFCSGAKKILSKRAWSHENFYFTKSAFSIVDHTQHWFYIAAWPAHLHFKVEARGAIDCLAEQVEYDLQSPLTHWFLVSLLSASWMSLKCERPAKWTKILISFPLLFSKAPYLPRTELISGKQKVTIKGRRKVIFEYFF